jgi:hypothetical protein
MMKKAKKALIVLMSMQVHTLLFTTQASAEVSDGLHFRYVKESQESLSWPRLPIPKISQDFTPTQRKILWESLFKIQKRMQSKEVLDCINKSSTYGYYPDETPAQGAQRFVIGAKSRMVKDEQSSRKRRQQVHINAGVNRGDSTDAYTRLGSTRNVKEDLTMYIVKDKMGRKNSDYWAGVILHEILHVYTYEHPGYDQEKDYYEQFTGNMMFEAEWCVSGKRQKNQAGIWYLDPNFQSNM